MTTPPLSPAAQAVLDAVVDGALPPFHVIARPMAAAAIRALVEQVVPEDPCGNDCCITQCERIRADMQSIAAELYGGAGALTRTMVVCPICGNKRCPHATDPALACTGSNEPDQPGSIYTTQPTETPDEHA